MYTDEQFDQLEQEEHAITEEAIAALLLLLASIHSDLETAIREFYQKYGKDGVVTWNEARKWVSDQDHRRRLTILLLLVGTKFDSALESITPTFKKMLKEVALKESDFFGVEVDFDDLIEKAWGVDEATWLERLTDDIELWKANVGNDLKRSMLRRDQIDDVLEQLNKRFMSIERILERLGLTESTAFGSLTRRDIFKELGIKKYRFFTREDERTCEMCGSLHGLIFPMSAYLVGETASPIHPRCRCWEVPVTD